MKVQPAVQAETGKMALGVGVLTTLMIAVFLIARQFDLSVLLGALLGALAAAGNFFLMALTVQKVTEDMPVLPPKEQEENGEDAEEAKEQPLSDEAKQAGKKMQLSFLVRLLMMGAVAVLAVKSPLLHPWAALLPMLFPRIVIALESLFDNKQKEA